jgi:hypothetical protein
MLSRSTSNGANNLRRAKSASCVQRRPSSSSLIDPVAAKQHAIMAATLAYERAHGRDWTESSPSEQKHELGRRRSNRAGRSEGQGSHFEANHASRRQSTKKLSHATGSSNDYPRSRRVTVNSFLPVSQHISPPGVNDIEFSKKNAEISSIAADSTLDHRRVRKSRSMYAPSSLRPATSIDAISFNVSSPKSMLQPTMRCIDETTTVFLEQDVISVHDIPQVPPILLSHNTIYQVDERVAKARDHHLQQFQMQKIRHRASLMLIPFKKGIGSATAEPTLSGTSNNGVTYGSGRSSPAQEFESLQRNITSENKQSTSLKDKIRRVFRKPSSLHIGLPIQQVEASRAHFGDILSPSSTMSTIEVKRPKILNKSVPESARLESPTPAVYSYYNKNPRPRSSAASETTVKSSTSRVTSWADSTLAGTTASRSSNPLTIIHEDLQQSNILSDRPNRRSSIGIFRRGTKHSSVDNIDPSPGVGIHQSAENNAYGRDCDTRLHSPSRKSSVAHDALPSQVRRSSLSSSRASNMIRATVRVVSSGSHSTTSRRSNNLHNESMNSIILPALKTEDTGSHNQSAEMPCLASALGWREKYKRNKHQRVHIEPKLVAPSREQIAGRMERSEDRWKQSLDEIQSLFYPHTSQIAAPDPNTQYDEKGSLQSATDLAVLSVEDVVKTAREPFTFRSVQVISPSLYSRNTDSASPKRQSNYSAVSLRSDASNDTGTAVITTSYPNIKYSVGLPGKPHSHLAKSSRDWRDWISTQVHDLETPPPEDLTLRNHFIFKPVDSGHRREHAQIVDGVDVSIGSTLPALVESLPIDSYTIKQQSSEPRIHSHFGPDDRPSSRLHGHSGLKSRSASCMNERFPLINTGRPPSRKASPHTDSVRPKKLGSVKTRSKDEDDITPSSSSLAVPTSKIQTRTALLPRPQAITSFQRSRSSLAHYTTSEVESQKQAKPTAHVTSSIPRPAVSPLHRPKSAIEVRAAHHNRVTPIPTSKMETDTTLVANFKGPYRERTESPQLQSLHESPSFHKENSPFPKGNSPTHTMREDDSSSIVLPSTPTSGQRLAEQFLTARRMKSETRSSVRFSAVGSPVFL